MEECEEKFEKIYENQGAALWTFSKPPKELVHLVESGKIQPCKVLDIGCGEGYYAIYLASNGFSVTAFDRSRRAISYAKQHAKDAGVSVDFFVLDYSELDTLEGKFDFIFDWRFLHEILDISKRKPYVENVHRLLVPGGKYLSVSFSGESDYWGSGKIRKAPTKIKLYFGKLQDLKQLFEQFFNIIEMKLIQVPEKPDMNIEANYFFMEKL
ncbi:MAG: class I SAM-dependent methyltransferase [Candidatus Aenigmarchaeota archaeon]|nr:class I SAM-dependent methyltransferase [Candidatus Aenigmarchaeota archaeon]